MQTKIYSATLAGIHANLVTVEIDISDTITKRHDFIVVGMPDSSIKESRKRIITALRNHEVVMPERNITINLSPASLRKEGSLFDLPITIGFLKLMGMIKVSTEYLEETLIIGELSLDGSINSVKGSLSITSDAIKLGKKRIILPISNAGEAALIQNVEVIGVSNIKDIFKLFKENSEIKPTRTSFNKFVKLNNENELSLDDIRGQDYAKRAIQIAAAGRHNIIFSGPPGAGKTMLAKRMINLMPDMSFEETVETTKIYSVCGKLNGKPIVTQRPFRSPHHSISRSPFIGGGHNPAPGEISLATNGVLFLDEFTEFSRETLEALREPLENKLVNIAKSKNSVIFPANFLLVAAYNPCPCGMAGDASKSCKCSPSTVQKYNSKLSGPLMDRIDIRIGLKAIGYDQATSKDISLGVTQEALKDGALKASAIQEYRFSSKNKFNSSMSIKEVEEYCTLSPEAEIIVKKAFDKFNLSMRSYHKVLKLARTIADLDGSKDIQTGHIVESIMYRFES